MEHIKKFLDKKNSNDTYKQLKGMKEWEKVKYGRGYLPRLVCRASHNSDQLWIIMKDIVSSIEKKWNCQVEGLWGNWYRDGKDYTPDHKDQYGCDIYCLSLGGSRRVRFRNDESNKLSYITTSNGDLYYFTEEFDNTHQHSVPKTTSSFYQDERISIVFFTKKKPKIEIIYLTEEELIDLTEEELIDLSEEELIDFVKQLSLSVN